MDIHRNNYNYTFEEYESDIKSLKDTLSGIENIHLIAMYRGSIPIVVHLSNLLNCEMSIIKLKTSNRIALDQRATFFCLSILPHRYKTRQEFRQINTFYITRTTTTIRCHYSLYFLG